MINLFLPILAIFMLSLCSAQQAPPAGMRREVGYIPMKDGIRLAYILYKPKPEGRFPVLLIYNPYWGGGTDPGADETAYLQHGYAVLGVSIRGTGCSEGRFTAMLHMPEERRDGAAVVEWAGTQPWSDGNVGMYGNSYSGISQLEVALQHPKHLKAIAAGGVIGDLYADAVYPGGIYNYAFLAQWTYQTQPEVSLTGVKVRQAAGDRECESIRAARPQAGTTFPDQRSHPLKDAWWSYIDLEKDAARIDVPTMFFQGWQDQQAGDRGPGRLFERITAPRKMILTNGGHGVFHLDRCRAARIRWFDRWLKGEHNGVEQEPPVTVWFETRTSGQEARPNWTEKFSNWPVPATRWDTLYLTGDDRLAPQQAGSGAAAAIRRYLYPAGSEIVFKDSLFAVPPMPFASLTYRSAPAREDTAIVGSPVVTLQFSSEREDTDFVAALHDVAPDGKVLYLQRGFLRASHRALDAKRSGPHDPEHPHDKVEPLVPGRIYEASFQIFPLGHVLRRGHSLELSIQAPPTFPLPNWGFAPVMLPGLNTVYHSAAHPSRIELPVVPGITAKADAPACGSLEFQPCRAAVEALRTQSEFLDRVFQNMDNNKDH